MNMRSKIRVKSNWFKGDRKKTPQEIAVALAFTIWRISDNTLKNVRKADFDIAIGEQYFSFLTEFLIFLVQVADRIVYTQLNEQDRFDFTSALVNRVADHIAENQSEWLGGPVREYKDHFVDRLNYGPYYISSLCPGALLPRSNRWGKQHAPDRRHTRERLLYL